ncbi:MAG: 30S ribosomal protein S2 [Clostridia bacterium]
MADTSYREKRYHIIDLQIVGKVDEAYKAVADIAAEGGKILFVGTKKQRTDAIATEAERCGIYVNEMVGGAHQLQDHPGRIARPKAIETMQEDGTFDVPKKEVIALKKEMENCRRTLAVSKRCMISRCTL